MHNKSSFNALIMPCNAPYNALHFTLLHYNSNQLIVTLCILNSVIIIYDKICVKKYIMNNDNAFYPL